MHTNEPRELQGVELGYDPRDIDAKGIYKVVVYFFLFALFFFGLGAIVFIHFGWGARTSLDARKPDFVGPKVQGNIAAKIDIMAMRQHERAMMESYGQLPNGKWRLPVERAMELVAGEGLPNVASDTKATSPGNTISQNATGPAGSSPTPSSTATSPAEPKASDLPVRDPGMSAPTPAPTPDAPAGSMGGSTGP